MFFLKVQETGCESSLKNPGVRETRFRRWRMREAGWHSMTSAAFCSAPTAGQLNGQHVGTDGAHCYPWSTPKRCFTLGASLDPFPFRTIEVDQKTGHSPLIAHTSSHSLKAPRVPITPEKSMISAFFIYFFLQEPSPFSFDTLVSAVIFPHSPSLTKRIHFISTVNMGT